MQTRRNRLIAAMASVAVVLGLVTSAAARDRISTVCRSGWTTNGMVQVAIEDQLGIITDACGGGIDDMGAVDRLPAMLPTCTAGMTMNVPVGTRMSIATQGPVFPGVRICTDGLVVLATRQRAVSAYAMDGGVSSRLTGSGAEVPGPDILLIADIKPIIGPSMRASGVIQTSISD